MSRVSCAILIRRSSGRWCSVRMLCSRSASLTRMTRMSSTIASSILRKFSACRSSLDENGDRTEFGHAFDDVRDVGAEQLLDPLDRGLGVLDDVVEQARRRWRRRPASCRRAGRRLRAGGRGRARPNGGPVPCARRPRRRTPASAARCRRPDWSPGPFRRGPRTGSCMSVSNLGRKPRSEGSAQSTESAHGGTVDGAFFGSLY